MTMERGLLSAVMSPDYPREQYWHSISCNWLISVSSVLKSVLWAKLFCSPHFMCGDISSIGAKIKGIRFSVANGSLFVRSIG